MTFTQALSAIEPIACGLRRVAASAEAATNSLRAFGLALIEVYAPVKPGNWPDGFSLLNRYVRTGVVPVVVSGERWEA